MLKQTDKIIYAVMIIIATGWLSGCNLGTSITPIPDTPQPAEILSNPSDSANTPDITPTITTSESTIPEETSAVCTPRTDWDTYTVVRGDNLTGIAQKVRSTTAELIAANCLDDPDSLIVGQTLYIPPQSADLSTGQISDPDSPDEDNSDNSDSGITRQYIDTAGFTFDYPVDWTITRLSGGARSTLIASYVPGEARPGGSNVGVQVTVIDSSVSGETLDSLVETSQTAFEEAEAVTVVTPPEAITLPSGLSGYRMITAGGGIPEEHYYFAVDNWLILIDVLGEPSSITDAIINSLRTR